MTVLFLVGEGKECPGVVDQLFDVETEPAKPEYIMAVTLNYFTPELSQFNSKNVPQADYPLVLNECGYEKLRLTYQPQVLIGLVEHFESLLENQLIAVARTKNALGMVRGLSVRSKDVPHQAEFAGSKYTSKIGLDSAETEPTMPLSRAEASCYRKPGVRYVGLLERNRNDSYEQRCQQLSEAKRQKLASHLSLIEDGKAADRDFFLKMRSEGNASLLGDSANGVL